MNSSGENLAKYYVTQAEDASSGHIHVYSKRRNSIQVPEQKTYELKQNSFISKLRRNSIPDYLPFEKKTDYDPNCLICQAKPKALVPDECSTQDDLLEISLPAPTEIPPTTFLTPVEPKKISSSRRLSLPLIIPIARVTPNEQNDIINVKSLRRYKKKYIIKVPCSSRSFQNIVIANFLINRLKTRPCKFPFGSTSSCISLK